VTVIGDREGRLKAWFDDHLVGVAFLRPDRYVAAACIAQEASKVTGALSTALSLTEGAQP
jgi:3-(3-hydroxy-phenyl)propionate hydroxylase